ncbi:MAG: rod shape-determining protein MreC [Acidiferrobacterales bacterium]|nr:rod shape-determining protein MreC [Acidiferrobacterales bacterium]
MANQFRKNSGWRQYGLIFFLSIALMVIDTRTNWLNGLRNVLAVSLAPIQIFASLPATAAGLLTEFVSSDPDIDIAYENLRNEYFQLKSETLLLRTLQEENRDLRTLLDASERLNEKVMLAELINVSIDPYNHRVLVGRGIGDSVYAGQAVIDDQGVIGQVTEVMPFTSGVMLITDPGHAMPVQVQRTGLRTVVYGTGSVSSLRVPFLNQNSDVQEGDILLSSGLGGRFPIGYPVATITEVEIIQDEAFMRVAASPIGKLDRSNHVLLLTREKSRKTNIANLNNTSKDLNKKRLSETNGE